jgi:hypothetical protein
MIHDELIHVLGPNPKTKGFKVFRLPDPCRPNYKVKAKNRAARKAKNKQARHMRKVA